MNICLKILFAIIATGLLSGCVSSSKSDVSVTDTMKQLCKEAMYGGLDLSMVQNMKPLNNSYLFNCALSAVASFPDEKPNSVKNRKERKVKVASFFIYQDIDVAYKDESGSTLLISVITSYIPSNLKVKFVKILISKGCDIKEKNKYGKSALELAEFTNEPEIIKILSEHNN